MDAVGGTPIADSGAAVPRHLCCTYDSDAELDAVAARYLAAGLSRGERAVLVGRGTAATLAASVTALGDVEALVAAGALQLLDVRAVYGEDGPASPATQLAVYDVEVAQALADGYRGLVVVADCTTIAADPVTCLAQMAWEQVAERAFRSRAIAAACLYDRRCVPPEAVDALAAVHPVRPAAVPFGVVPPAADGGAALQGEVDVFCAPALDMALATLPVEGPVLDLDVADLAFADAAALTTIAHRAAAGRRAGRRVVIRGARPTFRRCWAALGFEAWTGAQLV